MRDEIKYLHFCGNIINVYYRGLVDENDYYLSQNVDTNRIVYKCKDSADDKHVFINIDAIIDKAYKKGLIEDADIYDYTFDHITKVISGNISPYTLQTKDAWKDNPREYIVRRLDRVENHYFN